jgi:hypothetical protein
MPTETNAIERPLPWVQFRKSAGHPVLVPFLYSEWLATWAVFFLSRWTLLQALEYAGNLSILIAAIFYFADAGDRTKATHYQAWQVINTAQGKGGSGGRIDALEQLNDDHVKLVGVDVADAFLQGIELENADLHRGNLSATDLRNAHLKKANLDETEMEYANLREADLRGTKLRAAILRNVDLTGAVITGADLENADLRNADLAGVTGWEQISVTGTQIEGIKNAPLGFVAWAVKPSAVAKFPASSPTNQPRN